MKLVKAIHSEIMGLKILFNNPSTKGLRLKYLFFAFLHHLVGITKLAITLPIAILMLGVFLLIKASEIVAIILTALMSGLLKITLIDYLLPRAEKLRTDLAAEIVLRINAKKT